MEEQLLTLKVSLLSVIYEEFCKFLYMISYSFISSYLFQ